MSQIVQATFENGVFRPDGPLDLPPQTRVRLVIEPCSEGQEQLPPNPSGPNFVHPSPEEQAAAWKSIRELWRTSKLDSKGERLTREQLHERR